MNNKDRAVVKNYLQELLQEIRTLLERTTVGGRCQGHLLGSDLAVGQGGFIHGRQGQRNASATIRTARGLATLGGGNRLESAVDRLGGQRIATAQRLIVVDDLGHDEDYQFALADVGVARAERGPDVLDVLQPGNAHKLARVAALPQTIFFLVLYSKPEGSI